MVYSSADFRPNGVLWTSDKRRHFDLRDSTLETQRVTESDAGVYFCNVNYPDNVLPSQEFYNLTVIGE